MIARTALVLAAPLLLLQACAVQPEGGFAQASPPPAATSAACDASQVQYALGRSLNDSLRAELRARSGARVLREYGPRQGVTMDYNAQRLNLELDAGGKLVKLTCG